MRARGFSLVEVLVALGVFAAVSAAGVAALSLATRGAEQLEEASDRIAAVERFRGLMRADLYQLIDRAVYEPGATQPRASFMGGPVLSDMLDDDDEEALIVLVRSGWAAPAGQPRSELQAVTWLVKDGALIRRHRPFLDAVADTPHRDDVLFTGLERVEVSFLTRGRWRDETGRPGTEERAVSLRLVFVHPVYGAMTHQFLLGSR